MKRIFLILLGLAEGVIVGMALVAFLMVLDVIPRLIRFTSTKSKIRLYQSVILIGALIGILIDFYDFALPNLFFLNELLVVLSGLFFGIFVGLVAGALTEVLKVLPILSRRLGLKDEMKLMLSAIILGKALGSLVYWLFPQIWS
ncbi:stage V sporulation protein AB [Halonatronum saccharophilum]|uniref:stage V sporulation protein AB n=1 Tax=Halonatronum saccharophilum TaxID=150060 RepID=UPI00047FABB1|nr:stage V sporulation protein AB [Halonatronum saccharophilum]